MATVQELVTKLGFDVNDKPIKSLRKDFKALQDSFLKIGVASAGALAALVIPAATLEDKLRDALILTGKTGKDFEELDQRMTSAAKNLSDKLGVSASEIAESFYQVLSTGAEAMSPKFQNVAETAIKFAKTIGLTSAEAVERINDTLNAFQLEGSQAGHVANVFFTASKQVAATVPQLAAAMRDAAPAAATLGINLEDTTAILNALAESGVKGSIAGTSFRQVVLKLAKPTKEGARALKEFNTQIFKGGKLRPIIEIFKDMQKGMKNMSEEQIAANLKILAGEEAFARLSAILGRNLDEVQNWSDQLKKSEGALDLAFSQRMNTSIRNIDKLKEALKTLLADAGEPLLGFLADAAIALTNMVKELRKFLKENPRLKRMLSFVSGIVLSFGALLGAIAGVAKAFEFLGIGKIIGLFWRYSRVLFTVGSRLNVIAGILVSLKAIFDAVTTIITGKAVGITKWVKDLNKSLEETFGLVWKIIKTILGFTPVGIATKVISEVLKRVAIPRQLPEVVLPKRAALMSPALAGAAAGGQQVNVTNDMKIDLKVEPPAGANAEEFGEEVSKVVTEKMNETLRNTRRSLETGGF